jgi:hypothetical protein
MYLARPQFLVPVMLTAIFAPIESAHALFGSETFVLMEVVSNQVMELQRLAESVGIAKDQANLLVQINEGVQQTTRQIRALESIIERAQGVNPTSVQSLSEINATLETTRALSNDVQELVSVKLALCDQAVEQAGIQSDTAYVMGQEMVSVGSQLAKESESASPGRAQQISASASSAQMLAKGVELQTLSQISQLLAMNLELQKAQLDRTLRQEQSREGYLKAALTKSLIPLSSRPSIQKAIHRKGGKAR